MKGCYSNFYNEQIRGVLFFSFHLTHLSFFVEMGFKNHYHQTIPTLHSAQNKDVNTHVKQGTWATCENLEIKHHWGPRKCLVQGVPWLSPKVTLHWIPYSFNHTLVVNYLSCHSWRGAHWQKHGSQFAPRASPTTTWYTVSIRSLHMKQLSALDIKIRGILNDIVM